MVNAIRIHIKFNSLRFPSSFVLSACHCTQSCSLLQAHRISVFSLPPAPYTAIQQLCIQIQQIPPLNCERRAGRRTSIQPRAPTFKDPSGVFVAPHLAGATRTATVWLSVQAYTVTGATTYSGQEALPIQLYPQTRKIPISLFELAHYQHRVGCSITPEPQLLPRS